ncbi:MAG: aquaporin [Gaiellales bacterium]
MQKLLAELLGTFTLVFVGSLSIVAAGSMSAGPVLLVSVALGFGLALLIGLYAFGEVSGGHFNPAVSLAMFLDKRLPAGDLIGYWIAQVAGALLASIVVLIMWDSDTVAGTVTGNNDTWPAFVAELVLTALFIAVILQVTRSSTYGRSALTTIPLALVGIHVAAIPISGASVNPARSLGPAIIGTEFDDIWLYIVAPLAGGIVGWIAHKIVVMGDTNLKDDFEAARSAMR